MYSNLLRKIFSMRLKDHNFVFDGSLPPSRCIISGPFMRSLSYPAFDIRNCQSTSSQYMKNTGSKVPNSSQTIRGTNKSAPVI